MHNEKRNALKIIFFGLSWCEITHATKKRFICIIKRNKQLGAKKIQHEKQEINKLQMICMNLRSFKTVETQKKMNQFLILCYVSEISLKSLEVGI